MARCLAEANIVSGDLLEILAGWPEDATNDRIRSKVALACCKALSDPPLFLRANPNQSGIARPLDMAH